MNRLLLSILTAMVSLGIASALPLDTYTERSRLSQGNWYKISVTETGAHLLTTADLRKMGFSDPAKVRIFGYGGYRTPDLLKAENYLDDLPEVPVIRTDRGLVFYATGTTTWAYSLTAWRPVQNPYTTEGYYYLTDTADGDAADMARMGQQPPVPSAPSVVNGLAFHEKELVNPGRTGHNLLGEDFSYNSSQTFTLDMPDRVAGSDVRFIGSFMAKTRDENGYVYYTVNGNELNVTGTETFKKTTDGHCHYIEGSTNRMVPLSGNDTRLTVNVRFQCAGTVSVARLNYLAVNYKRTLRGVADGLWFTLGTPAGEMADCPDSQIILDVTDPVHPFRAETVRTGTTLTWRNNYTGTRHYYTLDPSANLPSPKAVGTVANQNLHAADVPDMVIITPADWMSQAERLAQLHRDRDNMTVTVIDQQLIFNEFSSGSRDARAFRNYLKMLYDRGEAAGTPLRHVLFFGRGTYDNRNITERVKALTYPKMPLWQTVAGATDTSSYSTDDYFGFLADGACANMGADKLMIGVGRMAVTSQSDAKNAVDKIVNYLNSATGNWRTRALLIADDQNNAIHMSQTDRVWNFMLQNGGSDISYHKLYTDEYEKVGNEYPQAKQRLFRSLEDGVAWMTYIGHANTTSWTHENLLTFTDINELHLKYFPVVYAATCEFQRFDDHTVSAGEIMWKLPTGGAIAMISANRPVFIDQNGTLSDAFGRHIFRYGDDGRRLQLGDINRLAKNDYNYGKTNNENKLRYALLGDPALRPLMPDNRVVIDRINGIETDNPDIDAVMKASQNATVEGHIAAHDGTPLTDFTGLLSTTMFDAEKSIVTKGNGGEAGKPYTFDQQGGRLFTGNDSIRGGTFTITVPVPEEIENNWRPATLQLYASNRQGAQAGGVCRDFYLYGTDANASPDTSAPVIDAIYINHPDFRNGDVVPTQSMLIVDLHDDRGINVATAGIGRLMTAIIDGRTSYSDLSESFIPSPTVNGAGTVRYQLPELPDGVHELWFRAWDIAGNAVEQTIMFECRPNVAPKLYDVYTDASPASVEANFYLSHDRPDALIDVDLTIYNLLGQPVRTIATSSRSESYLSNPITWDLTDDAGRRVGRGIYIYRALIREGGMESATTSHKLAVSAPQ